MRNFEKEKQYKTIPFISGSDLLMIPVDLKRRNFSHSEINSAHLLFNATQLNSTQLSACMSVLLSSSHVIKCSFNAMRRASIIQ